METQTVTAWEIKSSDLIILRGRHYLVNSFYLSLDDTLDKIVNQEN